MELQNNFLFYLKVGVETGILRGMKGGPEDVPCLFVYSCLAVQSHLTVKIVAPRVPDSQAPETIIKYKTNLL